VGRTTLLTLERKEYVPVDAVIAELDDYLVQQPELDFITFSGQGEPTLNSGLGKVLNHIKDHYPHYKVAILTNGTLFWDKILRAEVMRADVILPDLDAVSQKVFQKINRPQANLENERIINGLKDLRREFKGLVLMEVFLIAGLNDSKGELKLLKETLMALKPDRVQLNSLDRPGTEAWVKAMPKEGLHEIAEYFKPLKVEIVANPQSRKNILSFNSDIEAQILETIKRRPSTDTDLSQILNLHINELNKYLSPLLATKKIETVQMDRGVFFKIKD
jgi:wyosine [tRNA(Phe)-imidazoG37] synthetase (radical SAM superfamily)